MTSAAQHLATFGVSMADAQAFINANINNPQQIFNVASEFGVTNAMLGEIAGGFSAAEVESFFAFNGIDSSSLNSVVVTPPAPAPGGGFDFFPSEWLGLAEHVITLNNNTGILSNESIRSNALSFGIAEADYLAAFDPVNWADPAVLADGIFSTSELGFDHLGNLPATAQTVESLFYGSIINLVKSVDAEEASMLENFIEANEFALSNFDPGVTNELLDLLIGVLSTPAIVPLVSDEDLSQGLGFIAITLTGVLQTGTLAGLNEFF